ncbi:hypothetical protein D9M69_684790 [compost metagenome]
MCFASRSMRSTRAASSVYTPMATRSVNASVPASAAYCGVSGSAVSTNCGTTASRNTVPLGFMVLIRKPRSTRSRTDARLGSPESTVTGAASVRIWRTPR